ncbi:T9SS type A sorting domain-containing protein [Winogradskyella wichelsiae]|uniref:T9SS type A sorting domain-containing protein n=1 Tax=Winogradskyella wichelsiae TaxID=2697007 RepID=UPI003EF83F56
MKKSIKISCSVLIVLVITINSLKAQVPDAEQGLRADWMRGALGLLWLPERNFNGNIEGVRIDDFIAQINDLRTIDYVQLPLTSPNIFSPIHVGPHPIIESLWEGDTDTNGDPINLAVPREAVDDPLLSWLKAVRAAGLRTEIYVNSYNLLARFPEQAQDDYPDVSQRWMDWCDTNLEAQTFINSESYHDGDGRRKYMFCYAEFILKEYAMRYGDLVDAWCFDSADNIMEDECGDDPASEDLDDQRIYQAFAEACRAGNPNAAISFNNSVGERFANPFTTATYFDDYTFGHPFGGAGNMVEPRDPLYGYNFGIIEWMEDHNGYAFTDDSRTWNDNVVSHFFPKQSATSWNAGNTPCLTDEEFVEWTTTGLINGGAITWGTPLVRTNLENSPVLTLQPYALNQLALTDIQLKELQHPGVPNWSRQYTILPPAYTGIPYSHTLIEGYDLWDPEGDAITSLIALNAFPSWLTITETSPGEWTLGGIPTETTDTEYEFDLNVSSVSGSTNRTVELMVFEDYIPEPIPLDVQIIAAATTNYGVATVATMYSEVQTAPDGVATFRISIDVTPPNDKAVISGVSGGLSSVKSWGLGDGTDSNSDDIFTGSDNEWVESINNIQVIDFNANGGLTALEDISAHFKSITIANSQSTNDFVSVSIEDVITDIGKSATQMETINLEQATLISNITDFSVGTGNTSATNKWSVEGITVTVLFNESTLSISDTTLQENEAVRIFPNPANQKVFLNIKPLKTEIFDISGKRVKVDNEGNKELDFSNLNDGIYIVKIQTIEGGIVFKKLIKD